MLAFISTSEDERQSKIEGVELLLPSPWYGHWHFKEAMAVIKMEVTLVMQGDNLCQPDNQSAIYQIHDA